MCRVWLWVCVFLQACGVLWSLNMFVCGMFWWFMHLYWWLYVWAVHTWLEACWCYVAGLSVGDVVSECRLNHYWPVQCGPWGFRGLWPLGTRGLYRLGSVRELVLWWWLRAWIWYYSYGKSKLWLLMCLSRVIVLSMGPYSCLFWRMCRAYADWPTYEKFFVCGPD